MHLTGNQLIGATQHLGTAGVSHAINPATGDTLEPPFGGGTSADVDAACTLAAAAFNPYRATTLEHRALFLEATSSPTPPPPRPAPPAKSHPPQSPA